MVYHTPQQIMMPQNKIREQMNKQQLAAKIWQSANKMRSKIEANEYKDYILGFIFYKFLSDKLEKFVIEQGFRKSRFCRTAYRVGRAGRLY